MSRRLPALRPREVIRALERAGYDVHHVTGAHYILRHPDKPELRITVARHNKELKPKTVRSIIRKTGLTIDKFRNLL